MDLATIKHITTKPEYNEMIKFVQENIAVINNSMQNFYKTQSQFMDNNLTITHPTPFRNLRQILAEINRLQSALKDAYFKNSKKEIEIKIKERDIAKFDKNSLEYELKSIEIIELKSELDSSQDYIGAAIRSITNYIEQYNCILNSIGKTSFTEKDFEEEEEAYHIMKAFDQGTAAARSRGGLIDEGNFIYLTQIGINAGLAQKYVTDYLNIEAEIIKDGNIPSNDFYYNFLKEMAIVFKDCSKSITKQKGMTNKISTIATLGFNKQDTNG